MFTYAMDKSRGLYARDAGTQYLSRRSAMRKPRPCFECLASRRPHGWRQSGMSLLASDAQERGSWRCGVAEYLVLFLVVAAAVWLNWRLVAKTGIPGFVSLILYIPVLNLAALATLAFMEWPIEEETRRLRFAQSQMLDVYLKSRSDDVPS
jgi:hypothetical protein